MHRNVENHTELMHLERFIDKLLRNWKKTIIIACIRLLLGSIRDGTLSASFPCLQFLLNRKPPFLPMTLVPPAQSRGLNAFNATRQQPKPTQKRGGSVLVPLAFSTSIRTDTTVKPPSIRISESNARKRAYGSIGNFFFFSKGSTSPIFKVRYI